MLFMYSPTSSKIEEVIEELEFHTTEFTDEQRDILFDAIIERAVSDFKVRNADRLRKALHCAHRAKPIRLIALLHTCNADFPEDVVSGIYRHYNPKTDTMRKGWTAQHREPHKPDIFDFLFGRL
jgi:hypothetical protein